MVRYPDFMPVPEAREKFLAVHGFDETDDGKPWNKVRLGKFAFYIPNPPTRRKAIPLHDLHHVLTGYETHFLGEGEVAAWELASGGLGPFWTAFPYVFSVLLVGFVLDPRAIVRAFIRGRGQSNLFVTDFGARLRGMRLGELRRQLGIVTGDDVRSPQSELVNY